MVSSEFQVLTARYLSILGLNESASTAELKSAYRREIFKWHPDKFHNDPANLPAATERAKEINAANEYLSELHESGVLPRSTRRTNGQRSSQPQPQDTYRTQHTYNRKPFTPGFPDPGVFEVFVRSSHIISAGYNRTTQTLYIKFDEDVVYSYLHVPESVFAAFMAAESHGKFAHRNIYHQYQSVRH
jgi:curved DNA-binding protein CbpA